ncbi:MAG: hypothetical protein J3Q66DRAFT_428839 [Benniella sp.]|nr:MAG: hypothetical protein J3Q66DRAFT_428839 [Benniella sp.]
MKFSLIAAASAIAFAATSHAAELNLFTKENGKGRCNGLSIKHNSCYDVSDFGKVKSAGFISKSQGTTLIFYESKGCSGKYRKILRKNPVGSYEHVPKIKYVSGNIKSVWMMDTDAGEGNGRSSAYWPSTKATLGACRNYSP